MRYSYKAWIVNKYEECYLMFEFSSDFTVDLMWKKKYGDHVFKTMNSEKRVSNFLMIVNGYVVSISEYMYMCIPGTVLCVSLLL